MQEKYIECTTHGRQAMALLCTHLAHSLHHRTPVGFFEYDTGDTGRPDAWCNTCEEAWNHTQTEADRDQWFIDCQHKLVCVSCWDEAKNLNKSASIITFNLLTLEEIQTILEHEEHAKQNFPSVVSFPFPTLYKDLVTAIPTVSISSETILYGSVEATLENKESDHPSYWIFAGVGQGDRWLLDEKGQVFFGDHDVSPMQLHPLDIDFQQWLQLAFLIQQLDDWCDAAYDIKQIEIAFTHALNQIHPKLPANYPFEVE
ncbi:hypothetical protein [Myroides sp. TSA_177.3]|uniref:hypothetical protein n=1 Tax=Myroides sp. TSA_177.3 TaxID=3415650 RepID=UPI00404622F3